MKREIKFRAWLSREEKMTPAFNVKNIPYIFAEGVPKDCIILQYTGLKDKNGVEIYEGDICRILYTDWPSNTDPNIELEDYLISISHIGNIVYTAPSFEIELPDRYGDRSGMTLHYGTHGRIQVIGNIYQNPELCSK